VGDLEVPLAALEELVVNMLLHRDYFVSAPWRMMMFDNRIELISPGALPNNLTVENIRNGVSNIRNPLIASYATKELPYRGIGTGILRALAAVPDLGLESDHDRNLFIVRIPRRAVQA
jgi:ATP-dependent DNA helicase RecG